ncbi:3-oxoacyl-ACP synthase [Marinoscillum furvescens]|uniref:Transcription elongation GreA/GreB family factor n=1 Tax=Marinoscillum furvescens DSM 4134 TaxID=1122208 RepID=A0A3D9L4P2_MARFU|nr:3-oxoacyl-ACP synthase [Marinoscillum furvescens]REE00552.1 hypothetical protein C7460_105179 [Marinoscillum furvescens DSM 4134]
MDVDLMQKKMRVHEACVATLMQRKEGLLAELRNFQDAANNETKSSAGDKYETGRAMMHLEKEKVAGQLDQVLKMEQVIRGIKPEKELDKAALGSLIKTENGHFFLSVSLGAVDGVVCLSPVAPLGQALLNATPGDKVSFQGRTFDILEVI